MSRMPAAAGTLLAILLLSTPLAVAGSAVKDTAEQSRADELAAAADRLELAVDRAEDAELADMATRSQRADLLGRAKDLSEEAAVTLRQGQSRASLVTSIDAVTAGLVALADASVEAKQGETQPGAFGEKADAGAGLENPHAATTVIRFHGMSSYVLNVLPRLSESERADARQLVQSGEDVVALLKDVRRTDHGVRTAHLRSLEDITRQLAALHQTGLLDRKKGQPFVPSWRVPDEWIDVTASSEGLKAMQVRFDKPGSAWIILENTGSQARKYFVEIEFYDHVGESTGMAAAQSGFREELKPGELRRVLVPIIPVNPRFWDETTGFTVYVE